MAARSRFHSESKSNDRPETFELRRSKTYNLLVGRWKSFRRRRIILVLLAAWLLYLFFRHMPTDLPPVSERYDTRYGRLHPGLHGPYGVDSQDAFRNSDQGYDGPIRFYELATTLQEHELIRDMKGNVLFAISDLKSVPQVLPMACAMSQHNRSRVHLAFMGRHAAAWPDIRAANGLEDSGCNIFLHDARPDHAAQSSVSRLEVGASASLGHIHSAIRLSAVLTTAHEDDHLMNALRGKTSSLGLPLITLPANSQHSLSWISSLDAASLSQLKKIQIDIVIQARPESSASLMRLLRSIKDADYSGWPLPRMTVELPNNVDPFLARYLSNFRWPANGAGSESRLTIKHRLDARLMTPVQASMRTVESFYPADPSTSHLLLLSPNTELSPDYFQFLMHTLLEYGYGSQSTSLIGNLAGISLDLPRYGPDLKTKAPYGGQLAKPFTLWQAPASTAVLYFGDRWVEFHTFLSYRLLLDPKLASQTKSTPMLSHEYPAWMVPMLEMMQARGYYVLYPSFLEREGLSAVTVHSELSQSPEEYLAEAEDQASDKGASKINLADEALTADDEIARLMRQEQKLSRNSLTTPLLEATVQQREDDFTTEPGIPLMSFDGEKREWADSWILASKFAEDFAVSVGGCSSYNNDQETNTVGSLFCVAGT
ncbi:uncharacterized protein Z520_00865 [Fonsecaea multimorphosa CBS 102226]|uniref:Glycosyltransferase 2 n=1 Tax=Fonsecaea multimorphosa CBS 102226 TaxID=1442371 RepID=A0A0D2KDI7_9EURO|nr:uncharacterized protein Z520_00865 [Fonsecaea multimorphosa CBS 102226]KIY04173.1 hypothetical protein Z520_00865 [Fonsecaea multimorphosa CBS 102226]OAL32002.1 hypothetical protein AYO22_00872 [Fonsecaea multimorphosa]